MSSNAVNHPRTTRHDDIDSAAWSCPHKVQFSSNYLLDAANGTSTPIFRLIVILISFCYGPAANLAARLMC